MRSLCMKLHSDYLITISQIHTSNSHRRSSCCTYIGLMEPDTLSVFCHKNNIFIIVCEFYFNQFIFLTKCDCCKSCLSYICIVSNRSLLHKSFLRRHKQILAFSIFINRNHRRDFFVRH